MIDDRLVSYLLVVVIGNHLSAVVKSYFLHLHFNGHGEPVEPCFSALKR